MGLIRLTARWMNSWRRWRQTEAALPKQYGGLITAAQLRDRVKTILGSEDILLVIEAKSAAWTNLLVDRARFKAAFLAAA